MVKVSLPAGSFCAERAAITRAASDFVSVKDISTIATLDPDASRPIRKELLKELLFCVAKGEKNPLWPCEVCQSWLSKLKQQPLATACLLRVYSPFQLRNPEIRVLAFQNVDCKHFAVSRWPFLVPNRFKIALKCLK